MRDIPLRIAPALALFACVACKGPQDGTDVGNGFTSLEARGYDALGGAPRGLDLDGGVRVDELWVSLDRLRFRPSTDCSGLDERVDLEGPFVAELIEGGFADGPVTLELAPGPFCGFRTEFRKLTEADAPASAPPELVGASVFARGTTADGLPFAVTSRQTQNVQLGARDGSFELGANESLVLAVDVGRWLSALRLDQPPTGKPEGPIVIDDQQNADELREFEQSAASSAKLYRDADGDHALGAEERAAGSELTL